MGPFAAYICDVCDKRFRELSLDSQTPLLNIRTNSLGWNGCDVQWKRRAGGRHRSRRQDRAGTIGVGRPIPDVSDAGVVGRKRLRHAEDERRTGLEGTGIGFVAGAVLKEDTVAASDGCLTVAERVPGKPYAWRRVEKMAFHATDRCTAKSATHQTHVAHDTGVELEGDRVEGHRSGCRALIEGDT